MHHNHHQRFYQYAGPPSIVMGTWGDRVSRSHFAPPPAPFAMPPAGVPGGRLGPAPNRMNTGYHSLQYTPSPNEMKERHHNLEKKGSSAKYSRDGSDQLHKLPQVKAFVNQVEQSAKHQLKSAKPTWNEKSATIDAKPRKSSSSNRKKSSDHSERDQIKAPKPVIPPKMDEKSMILNSSKTPNGSVIVEPEPDVKKPQFYFGQSMSDVVKKSSISNGTQSAIDKVKKNEALTHPKRAELEANFAVTELQKRGKHTSIITVSDSDHNDQKICETTTIPKKVNSQKASSMSSGVSSLSSSSSSSSSSRSSPAKENTSQIIHNNKKSVEPTQDSIRKAFEAQLIAGKSRLKKTPLAPAGENEVGHVVKPPPAPVPPPPPPPSEEALRNGALRSYEIPQAPKLKKTTPTLATKKGLVAPNGISAREELMMAIRGTGGFQGLRKINSGKNL